MKREKASTFSPDILNPWLINHHFCNSYIIFAMYKYTNPGVILTIVPQC